MIKLDQYRDVWLGERFKDVIGFYPREFYPLDNFSSFKVEYKGYLYASAEEAFQASHFLDIAPDVAEKIKNSHSAHDAQKIFHENIHLLPKNYRENEILIMEEILRCKIEQNPYVLKKLLETKDYKIVEDSPKDDFWGWGLNRKGKNMLGNIWMKLREEYKNK